ncbi:MAG: TlpA family protein disulfide reductase [Gammaproteobacteria bacterium]|nr:TlpA family protein disulfide reductase [Gammaproteobacteria bacterium]
MNKTPNHLLMVIVGLVVNLITIIPANADDGQLMEAYPPNYEAKNFELSDLAGEMHELEDYRGKHVLVNFWSMSCNVCKSEMTTLQSAHELLDREDLVIVSIHAGDPSEGVESVLKLNNINYPVLFDIDLQLGDWGIPIMPTSFIVSPKGNVLYRAVGTRVWNSPFMIDFMQGILDSDTPKPSSAKPL